MVAESRQVRAGGAAVYDLAGAVHKVVLDGEATGGTAAIVEITLHPGAGTPLHSDAREDISLYVVRGELGFSTSEGSRTLDAGSSLFVPRGTVHGIANPGSTPVTVLMVSVPAGIEGFLKDAATVLPAGVPAGPPPPEALAAFGEVAGRYGITLHGAPE
jgi:quercetin dioxygenase-like cupin family protein